MKIHQAHDTLSRLGQPPGKHQHTFPTPLDRLPVFVAALLAGTPPIASGVITLRTVVFDPRHLIALLQSHNLVPELTAGTSITGSGPEELHSLLIAAFSDCLDFYFVPRPHRFRLYVDHDEFTTVFAPRKGPVSRIATAMSLAGLTGLPGQTRGA